MTNEEKHAAKDSNALIVWHWVDPEAHPNGVIIHKDDFNPKIHKLWTPPAKKEADPPRRGRPPTPKEIEVAENQPAVTAPDGWNLK